VSAHQVNSLLSGAGLTRLIPVFNQLGWYDIQFLKSNFSNPGNGVVDTLERLGHGITHAEEQTLRQKFGLVTVDDSVATTLPKEVTLLLQQCGLEKYGARFHWEGFDDVDVIREYIDYVLAEIELLPEEQVRLRSALGSPVPAPSEPPQQDMAEKRALLDKKRALLQQMSAEQAARVEQLQQEQAAAAAAGAAAARAEQQLLEQQQEQAAEAQWAAAKQRDMQAKIEQTEIKEGLRKIFILIHKNSDSQIYIMKVAAKDFADLKQKVHNKLHQTADNMLFYVDEFGSWEEEKTFGSFSDVADRTVVTPFPNLDVDITVDRKSLESLYEVNNPEGVTFYLMTDKKSKSVPNGTMVTIVNPIETKQVDGAAAILTKTKGGYGKGYVYISNIADIKGIDGIDDTVGANIISGGAKSKRPKSKRPKRTKQKSKK
jgi:chemotaxis protein histidine kinase CheA